jgi:hypothetical protein
MENTDTVLSAPKVRTRGGQHRLAANGVYLLNLVEGEFCEFPSMKVLLEVSSHWVSIEHIMPCRDGGHRPPRARPRVGALKCFFIHATAFVVAITGLFATSVLAGGGSIGR